MTVFCEIDEVTIGPSARLISHPSFACAWATGGKDLAAEYLDVGAAPMIEAYAANDNGVTIIDFVQAIVQSCVSPVPAYTDVPASLPSLHPATGTAKTTRFARCVRSFVKCQLANTAPPR